MRRAAWRSRHQLPDIVLALKCRCVLSGALAASLSASRPDLESVSTIQSDRDKKMSNADQERWQGQGAPARRSRRRHLFKLVCAHGSRSGRKTARCACRCRRASSRAGSSRTTPSACSPAGRPNETDVAPHRADRALGGAAHRARSSRRPRLETVDGHRRRQRQRCSPTGAMTCRRCQRARGARRLAARSAADLRQLRGRPLQHAGACRRQAGRRAPSAATR